MSGMRFFGSRPQTVADLFNQGGGIDFDNIPLQGFWSDPISQIGVAAAAQSMRPLQASEPLGNSIRRMLNEMRGETVFPLTPYAATEPPAVQQPAGIVANDEDDLRRQYYADNLAKNQQYYGTASGKQELANMDPGWKAMMKATGSI